MRKMSRLLPAFLLVLAGCGRSAPPPALPKPMVRVAQRVVPKVRPTWDPSLVEGGFMIPDGTVFRDYVNRSEVVAIGTLTSWEGFEGRLRVERALRGEAGTELSLRASGGFVRPKPGQRVIVLLWTKKGRHVLNSFCAAGGLYDFSQPLANLVEDALEDQAR